MKYNSNTSIKLLRQSLILFVSLILVACSSQNEQKDSGVAQASDQKTYKAIEDKGIWPSFRGEYASGAVDNQNLLET